MFDPTCGHLVTLNISMSIHLNLSHTHTNTHTPSVRPPAFTSWKHWRKIDLCLNDSRLGVPSTLSGPFFLRAGYMWQKIEDWCGRSGEYGREIKASLISGRPLYPNTSNANLSAFQAVYAFYSGQYVGIASQPTGLFGGFQAYDVISNTRWEMPGEMPDTVHDIVPIAMCRMKVIMLRASTGQVYSISRQTQLQLVATPCPGGIRRHVSGTKIHELPVNIEDGKDSLLRWFEEHAHRLHQNYYAVGFLDPQDDDDMDDNADAVLSLLKFPTANDTANCSRAVTRGVEIVASAIFAEEMGMFVYSIRMRLLTPDDGDSYVSPEQRGFDTCQLVSRHWKISKLKANRPPVIDEVRGEGVIGCFPILCEGEYVRVFSDMQHRGRKRGAFSYQSCTEADCPGAIEGYLQFRPDWGDGRPSGEIFNARVDPFPLTFSHFLY